MDTIVQNRISQQHTSLPHLQLPVALRRVNSDTVSIAVVGSTSERLAVRSAIEMDQYNCIVLYLSIYIAPLNSHRQTEALLVQ